MQKTILYITNGITGSGGLERVVSLKASYFADEYGYDVHIVTLNDENKAKFYPLSDKITIHNIDTTGNIISFYKTYIGEIKRIIKFINLDIIFVADDGLKGVLFPIIFKPKCKVIYERHTTKAIHGGGLKAKLISKIMDYGSSKFDNFIVLTNGNKKDWPKAKNLEVIPNPIPFSCEGVPDIFMRNKIISVGSLSKVKGHDILINAWGKIAHKFPHITLEIYGEKKDNYHDLISLIHEQKLEGRVIINNPTREIKEKYLESRICVLPSRVEGFGMVLIEAMECGVPCIATKCEGPMDIISNGNNGFLININDADDLVNKLAKMLLDEDLLNNLSSNCRITASQYRIDFIINQWNNLII